MLLDEGYRPQIRSAAAGGKIAAIGGMEHTANDRSMANVGTYRSVTPENVGLPTVPVINLSMQDVAQLNGGVLPMTGNEMRGTAIARARARLGLDKNSAAYIPASNVTRNGEEYILKVTNSSLKKCCLRQMEE